MRCRFLLPIVLAISLAGCSSKMLKVAGIGFVSGAAGAGIGYTVMHHGARREYRTTNTIIAGSLFAMVGAGIAYWHLTSLENQQVELATKFSRASFLDRDVSRNSGRSSVSGFLVGDQTIRLDETTRWVFPEFNRRDLPSERGETELIPSHYAWEISRPGYFVTREQDPSLFKDEASHEKK